MVQFFAVRVSGPKLAAFLVPVQFQELGRTRTSHRYSLAVRRLVALKWINDLHAQNFGVQPQGALDISNPQPRIHEAELHATEGSQFGTAYTNGEELDHLGFEVENLQAAVERLEEKGVKVMVRPGTIGGWREAFVKDPDGIWIELVQRKKAG